MPRTAPQTNYEPRRRDRHQTHAGFLIIGCIGLGFLLSALLLFNTLQTMQVNAHPEPNPWGAVNDAQLPYADFDDGFPPVDWDYWEQINSRIVGWITVAGTNINHPIVQAPKDEPEFYLSHDIYDNENPYGCPYLDVDCADEGLTDSMNAIVLGHHSSDGNLFADFARYADQEYLLAHREILLQTPQRKLRLKAVAAEIVRGTDQVKRTYFAGIDDFQRWWEIRRDASYARSTGDESPPQQIWTFVTCSYYIYPQDERTLVYATEG